MVDGDKARRIIKSSDVHWRAVKIISARVADSKLRQGLMNGQTIDAILVKIQLLLQSV